MSRIHDFLAACRASESVRTFSENFLVGLSAASPDQWQLLFEQASGGQDEPEDQELVLNLLVDLIYEDKVPVSTLLIVAQGA